MTDAPGLVDRDLQRLRWQCRRGMLELDLLFERFLDLGYAGLDAAARADFERLLREPDQMLHDWLMQKSVPDDEALKAMVARILVTVTPPRAR